MELLSGSAGRSVIPADLISDLQRVLNDYSPLIYDYLSVTATASSSAALILEYSLQVWESLDKNTDLPNQLVSDFTLTTARFQLQINAFLFNVSARMNSKIILRWYLESMIFVCFYLQTHANAMVVFTQ